MANEGEDGFDPTKQDAREVAGDAAENREEFLTLMPHFYRGALSQSGRYLDRLDLTVDWAIAVVTAVLALGFQSSDVPPYLIPIGMVALSMFLLFDVRRYRSYDAIRARVRLVEENVYANALNPVGATLGEWREELGEDLRKPMLKVSYREALSRRLKRVYFPLYVLLAVAWLFRITLFVPNEPWRETAAVPGVSGEIIVGIVGAFYLALILVTFWPRKREAKGEFHGEEPGDWKERKKAE
ncbi:Uncharacterized membrane protein [Haladaptatus litoreus]|uniref:Uncharacterized membrane protein n=1 Tax=Haladaptatus litoreus TaxID=553468 RepID=A0A1N6X5D7_9EURY|nr:DUF2270 domain-containing protein [Haladaptatus litoreus]SIQ97568.1 Uncharacterized membrane protein [Haladaptatus litoreus]